MSAAAAVILSFGCTPRAGIGGGGGGPIDTDGSTAEDSGAPGGDVVPNSMDSTVIGPDVVTPPVDVPLGKDVVIPTTDLPVGPDVIAPSCGDGMCNGTETCMSCARDCGACPATCGDGMCNGTETCTNCARDCGACPATCGDGMCNGTETCTSCARDCGACPTSCTGSTCGTCTEVSGCSWCRTTNACVQTSTTTCSDRVIAPSGCTTTTPINLTNACTVTTTTSENNCGFRLAQSYSCTPGTTLTFGCTGGADAGACGFSGGTCVGDPIVRVCAGASSPGCSFAERIMPMNAGAGSVTADDDACGLCPWVRITCPSVGAVTVFTRAYNIANSASCTLSRQ